jgi:hypothetical protein
MYINIIIHILSSSFYYETQSYIYIHTHTHTPISNLMPNIRAEVNIRTGNKKKIKKMYIRDGQKLAHGPDLTQHHFKLVCSTLYYNCNKVY